VVFLSGRLGEYDRWVDADDSFLYKPVYPEQITETLRELESAPAAPH
jgi:hypothetical protein